MVWLLLILLPVTVLAGLDLRCRGEPPSALQRLGRACRRRWRPVSRRRAPPVDVFDTLWVQARLGAVADEILRLETDAAVFARAARLRATRGAYDDLLAEACRLAGVGEPGAGVRISDAARTSAELELASRGWSW